jgi:hypothetical protein
MRWLLAWLLVAMAGASTPVGAADPTLKTLLSDLQLAPLGGLPPAFELERFSDGRKVTLAEHHGRPVLLYFWATW